MQVKIIYSIAALFGTMAVVIGALNAHYFKRILDAETLAGIDTAVKYQFIHTIMMFVSPLCLSILNCEKGSNVSWLFIIGTALFSGSIYILTFLKYHQISFPKFIGLITPVGGIFLILGWVSILYYSLISK